MTLVELMISITLGLLVVMAATALLLSSKAGYATQDEGARLQETGRYAIEAVGRAVRQASFENWESDGDPLRTTAEMSANLAGLDARTLSASSAGIDAPAPSPVNDSDVLAVRFFGAGKGAADGTVVDCAGYAIAEASTPDAADGERGWSVFYVGKDASGESELYCKYRAANGNWAAAAIARGVESFQVLYGVDTDGDGLPNRFLNAAALDSLDASLALEGADAAAKAADRNRKSHWKKVTVVKVALLVRGSQATRSDALDEQYDLFGSDYANAQAASDGGTRIREAELPATIRNRARKVFAATILVRNQPV